MKHVTIPEPMDSPTRQFQALTRATFAGNITPSDLNHMARAILQMSDEIAELRKRVSDLEAGR